MHSLPGRIIQRRAVRLAATAALTGLTAGGVASAQRPSKGAGPEDVSGSYEVRADNSSLKEIGGERIFELETDTIYHQDITVTSDRGFYYVDRGVTFLVGNVGILQGTMRMIGDEGEYRRSVAVAVLRQNVRVLDGGWRIDCDEARYNRDTGIAWLVGNVVARDSATTLLADSLLYDRDRQIAEVFGDVRVANADEGFVVEGEHGFFYRAQNEGVIDRKPHLIVDADGPEPVTIDSDTMRIFPDRKHALAYYTVKILKGTTVTQCDSAVIYDDRHRAELYGKPLARQEDVSMAGSAMTLFYDENEVTRIDIEGSASLRELSGASDSLSTPRNSWIEGDTMSLYLHENSVDSIRVVKDAISQYFPSSRNKLESNYVRGDSMFFRFDGDSLGYVRIMGNSDGIYRFLDVKDGQTTDSLRAVLDSTLEYHSFDREAEKVVYAARRIEFFAGTKDLVLRHSARLDYQNRALSGEEITYFSSIQMLDTRGNPKLVDAGETFFGERMDYDLDSGTGLVHKGSTKFQQGFYFGEDVGKVGDNEMKVWKSTYTTCDLKEPHYHFGAREMKVYPGDKVVSGPIWLYVGKTPIAFLPFMANNIERGRRSGILRPEFEFGITKSSGRYIRNVGYYWATNDYTDFSVNGDFNEDSSFRFFIKNRYKLRYRFNGNVDYDFFRNLQDYTNEWRVKARHHHDLGERFTLDSDLSFVSSDRAPSSISRIDDVERVIDRSIRSNVSLRKSWGKAGFSASMSRTQNLDVVDPGAIRLNMTLPNVTLSIPSRNLYFGRPSKHGRAGVLERVLSGIRYSPGLSGQRRVEEKRFEYKETVASTQSLGFSSPWKVGFLNVSPALSASNVYTRSRIETLAHMQNDTLPVPYEVSTEADNQFSWRTSATMSTNLYGTFYPRVGRLRGVRHTVSPTAQYSFTPSTNGRPATQRFNVTLRNALDLKVLRRGRGGGDSSVAKRFTDLQGGPGATATVGTPADRGVTSGPLDGGGGRTPDDRTVAGDGASGTSSEANSKSENVEKISGVVLWTLSSSYDPKAPERKGWSTVRSAVNTRLLGTKISLNQTFDPYLGDVLSTQVTSQIGLHGMHPFGMSKSVNVRELNVVAAADTSPRAERGARHEVTGGEGSEKRGGDGALGVEEGMLPWNLSVNMSYSKNGDSKPRSTLDLRGDISLTDAWRVSYWTSYDVQDRAFRGQNYSVTRDLHCWEMSFSRQLLGDEWQYYFKINLRAHPEIYAESGRRGLGGFGSSGLTNGSFFQ